MEDGAQWTCADPCHGCGKVEHCRCDHVYADSYVEVGQLVPKYFKSHTKYRQRSALPWLVSGGPSRTGSWCGLLGDGMRGQTEQDWWLL